MNPSEATSVICALTANQLTVVLQPAEPATGVLATVAISLSLSGGIVTASGETFDEALVLLAERAYAACRADASDRVKRVKAAQAFMPPQPGATTVPPPVPVPAQSIREQATREVIPDPVREAVEAVAAAVPKPLPPYQGTPPSAEDMFGHARKGTGDDATFEQFVRWCSQAKRQPQLDHLQATLTRMLPTYSTVQAVAAKRALNEATERLGVVAG